MTRDQMIAELKDLADRSWHPGHGNREVLAASAVLATMVAALLEPGRMDALAVLVGQWNTSEVRRHNAGNN